MAHVVKSRRSIISGLRLTRSAAMIISTVPATNQIPIHHYPSTVTEMSIDGLLDVRR